MSASHFVLHFLIISSAIIFAIYFIVREYQKDSIDLFMSFLGYYSDNKFFHFNNLQIKKSVIYNHYDYDVDKVKEANKTGELKKFIRKELENGTGC